MRKNNMIIITHNPHIVNIFWNMKKYLKKSTVVSAVTNVVIVTMLVAVTLVAVMAVRPAESTVETTSAIYSGDENSGGVALMFNVYQNTEQALKIAELLVEHRFRATFFVGGKWVEQNSTALLSLYNMGMEIGNHGYLHRDHSALNYQQNIDEILLAERLVDAYLKSFLDYENCKLFAPPSGAVGEKMFDACAYLDYKVIMWTRDTIDWRDQDADLIFSRAVKDLKAGDLVLLHPTPATLTALPKILEYIKSANLKADTVSNVIG